MHAGGQTARMHDKCVAPFCDHRDLSLRRYQCYADAQNEFTVLFVTEQYWCGYFRCMYLWPSMLLSIGI